MKRIIPIVVACVVAVTVGAQTPPPPKNPAFEWGLETHLAEGYATSIPGLTPDQVNKFMADNPTVANPMQAHATVAKRYLEAGREGKADLATIYTMNEYYEAKNAARSAPQASQATDEARLRLELVQVGQNQRIVALLEKIAAQPKK